MGGTYCAGKSRPCHPILNSQALIDVCDAGATIRFFMALILAIIPLVLFISGDRPLAKRLITKLRKPAGGSRTQTVSPAAGADAKQTGEPKNDGPDRLAEPAVKA